MKVLKIIGLSRDHNRTVDASSPRSTLSADRHNMKTVCLPPPIKGFLDRAECLGSLAAANSWLPSVLSKDAGRWKRGTKHLHHGAIYSAFAESMGQSSKMFTHAVKKYIKITDSWEFNGPAAERNNILFICVVINSLYILLHNSKTCQLNNVVILYCSNRCM